MLVKSGYTEKRMADLLEYVYEAQNSEVCQVVGDHLYGNIDIDLKQFDDGLRISAISYFLTHYKGSGRQITISHGSDDDLQTLCEAMENSKQLFYNNHKLTLDIEIGKSKVYSLLNLLQRQFPVNKLLIKSYYLEGYKSDVHFLSQIFTTSNTLRVLDISRITINLELAACLANLRNVQLHHIRMYDCDLGDMGAEKIGEMLYHNNSITSVDLTYNYIGDDGVERLVYHVSVNNKLQHVNLSENYKITAVGAGHLRRLIATDHPTLTSIELSDNHLEDEGVHMILSSLTVTMEHIGLRRVHMTSSSSHIIAATLHKVKSISFGLPDDCEGICDSLTNTTVLKKLELGKVSGSVNYNYFSAIRHNDSIEKLQLDDVPDECVTNIAKLLEQTQKLTDMIIKMDWLRQSPSSQVILLLADSLTVNNSVKVLKYYDESVEQATMLKFLEQLKQANTIEEITFGVSSEVEEDDQFKQNVEMIVQQINQIRSTRGVSSQLKVTVVIYWEL